MLLFCLEQGVSWSTCSSGLLVWFEGLDVILSVSRFSFRCLLQSYSVLHAVEAAGHGARPVVLVGELRLRELLSRYSALAPFEQDVSLVQSLRLHLDLQDRAPSRDHEVQMKRFVFFGVALAPFVALLRLELLLSPWAFRLRDSAYARSESLTWSPFLPPLGPRRPLGLHDSQDGARSLRGLLEIEARSLAAFVVVVLWRFRITLDAVCPVHGWPLQLWS